MLFLASKEKRDAILTTLYFRIDESISLLGAPPPSHVYINGRGASCWAIVERVDIASIGDILASCRNVFIHGDPQIPDFPPGLRRRPLGSFGVRCCELGVLSGYTENPLGRINPIS